jgi:hypothetical protein
MQMLKANLARAPLRAAAAVLIMLSAAAMLGGCAGSGTSGDYWRERPASQNYQRLPIR